MSKNIDSSFVNETKNIKYFEIHEHCLHRNKIISIELGHLKKDFPTYHKDQEYVFSILIFDSYFWTGDGDLNSSKIVDNHMQLEYNHTENDGDGENLKWL